MSDTKFTPGPWRIDDCGDVRSMEDGEVIAVVLSDTDEFKTANLIAAAPELYGALEAFIDAESVTGDQSISLQAYDKAMEEAFQKAMKALAKARGAK